MSRTSSKHCITIYNLKKYMKTNIFIIVAITFLHTNITYCLHNQHRYPQSIPAHPNMQHHQRFNHHRGNNTDQNPQTRFPKPLPIQQPKSLLKE